MTLAPHAIAILVLTAFAAGFIDAIAGGGGLLTAPMLFTFVPQPHLALGTNKGQSVFGAISSAVSYWRRGGVDRARAPAAFVCGLLGSLVGARAQLAVPSGPLMPIALGLLVLAAIVAAFRPRAAAAAAPEPGKPRTGRLVAICLFLGAYDGFFGPGTGSLLIIAFVTFLGDGMTRASGNAKIVNLGSNIAAFTTFAVRGTILWHVSVPMAAGNAAGAFLGARTALKRGDRFVRWIVLAVVGTLIVRLAFELVLMR